MKNLILIKEEMIKENKQTIIINPKGRNDKYTLVIEESNIGKIKEVKNSKVKEINIPPSIKITLINKK